MASAMPAIPTARSMLEEMLAALKLGEEKPKDVPPALPTRPTLKRRPPSTKNILPTKFKVEGDDIERSSKDTDATQEKASQDSGELSYATNESKRTNESDESNDYEEVPDNSADSESSFKEEKLEHKEALDKDNHEVDLLRLEELEKLVLKTTEELKEKEEENAELLQQLQQYENNWSLCNDKMNSMEEMYQKQIDALKMNIAAAQKTLAESDAIKQPGKLDSDTAAARTLEGRHRGSSIGLTKNWDDRNNSVQQLTKEFEKQKKVFEDDARALDKVKPRQPGSILNSIEELRNLKAQYKAWKKEYKVRLHNTKKELLKLRKSDGEKTGEGWWFKRRKKTPDTRKGVFCLCLEG
ncbi:hypothetical protein Cni_G24461 [Canna indica]|uniref:Uncharacterized protein n=1 Tax=Canna indica TaxID=4628 RepID=A0AAQ3KW67_9LILI|nr:hypothetical protein Cni_G24461 [Canna indica]